MHRQLTNLPEGDVIVHSGDFTMMGTEGEALDFMEWFCDLPHRHKVFIAGNHDFCLRGARLEGLTRIATISVIPESRLMGSNSTACRCSSRMRLTGVRRMIL